MKTKTKSKTIKVQKVIDEINPDDLDSEVHFFSSEEDKELFASIRETVNFTELGDYFD